MRIEKQYQERYIVHIVLIVLLIAASAFVLVPLQEMVRERMAALKTRIVAGIERAVDRDVSYESISPSIFRYVEVRGLRIHGRDGEPDTLLTIRRFKVYYSIWRAVAEGPSQAVTEVRLENTDINLRQDRDEDVLRYLKERLSTEADFPVESMQISGRNLSLSYRGSQGAFSARDMVFGLHLRGDTVDVEGEAELRADLPQLPFSEAGGHAEMTARIRNDGRAGRGELTIQGLETGTFRLQEQTFRVAYEDRKIDVRKVKDDAPVDVAAAFDLASGDADIELLAEGLTPASLLEFRGALSVFDPWLAGTVSGSASASYDGERGTVQYAASLRGTIRHPALSGEVRGSLRTEGSNATARVQELALATNGGSASFEGTIDLQRLYPDGKLAFRDFSYGGYGPVDGTVRVSAEEGGITLRSPQLRYGGLEVAPMHTRLYQRNGRVRVISDLALKLPERTSNLHVAGTLTADERFGVEATAILDELPLSTVNRLGIMERELSVPLGLERSLLSTRIHLSARGDGTIKAQAPYLLLQDPQRPSDYLSLAAGYEDGVVTLRNLVGTIRGHTIAGSMRTRVTGNPVLDFRTTVNVDGIPYRIDGRYTPDRAIVFDGNYGLNGRAYILQEDRFLVRASVDDAPVPFLGRGARASVQARGVYQPRGDWSINVSEFRLSDVRVSEAVTASIAGRADMNPQRLRISELRYEDGFSTLDGEGTVVFPQTRGGRNGSRNGSPAPEQGGRAPLTAELTLNGAESEEQYNVRGIYTSGTLEATVDFQRSPLGRLGVTPIRGFVNGELAVRRSEEQASQRLQFDVERGFFNNDSFDATGTLTMDDDSVGLRNAELRFLTHRISNVTGSLNLEAGDVEVKGRYDDTRPDHEASVEARFEGDIDTGTGRLRVSQLRRRPFEGTLVLDGIRLDGEEEPPWEFAVDRGLTDLEFSGAPNDALRGTLQDSGEFEVSLSEPLPVRFEANGVLKSGQIETNLTRVELEIGKLPRMFDWNDVRLTKGSISGSLRMVGRVNDPDFYGTLTAEEVRARVAQVADPLKAPKVFLVFQEKVLQVQRFEAPTKRGTGIVEGTVVLNRWSAEEYRFTIQSTGKKGAHIVHNFEGVKVDGYATGTLQITGSPRSTTIEGDVVTQDTSITLAETPELSSNRIPDRQSTVNFTFRTAGRVEFLWPSSQFPVIRAFAQAGDTVKLHSSTADGEFSLQGDVGIQGGEIYYFDRSFYVRRGAISFNEDEQQFDPRISVRAEIREVASNGPVRIRLIADNSRLSEFSPRFESSPPLSNAEIASILGQNIVTGQTDDAAALSSAVRLPSDMAVQFGLINSFENQVRDTLNLDLFSVRTHVFENLVLGAIDGANYPLDNRPPSLGQYLDNTTVFMGKYLGSELFLELLVELRSTNPLSSDIQSLGGLEVDSEFSMEWQTPFFLLQWNFFPRNPQSLFVTDSTFEFSWEFSY